MKNLINIKTIVVSGNNVSICYWATEDDVCVAGFDENNIQVTRYPYKASIDTAEAVYQELKAHAINILAETVESDLKNNPDLHYISV